MSPWCMFLHSAKLFSENLYGYVGVVNELNDSNIILVLFASKKIDKTLVAV